MIRWRDSALAGARTPAQLEHATRAMENRLLDLRAGLAELLGYSEDQAEHMTDNELLETATIVIRRAQ